MSQSDLLVIANSFPNEDDSFVGGIFVKEQLRHVAGRFKDVYVVFPSVFGLGHRPKGSFRDYSFGNVHVIFLGYIGIPPYLRALRTPYLMLLSRALARLVRKRDIRPGLIHAHFTWPSGRAGAELKKALGVPLVVTEHTSLTLRKAHAERDSQFLATWNECDALIRIRDGDLELFRSMGVPESKLYHVPNGFDSGRFRPLDASECRSKLNIPADKKVVLSVGMLDEVKGYDHLLEAMRTVASSRDDVACYIIGGGPMDRELRERVESLGLRGVVSLVGNRPYGEMPLWMNACDVLAHSSLSESGPMVLFEAMACGKPYIGTSVGMAPEVVTSDEFGILCSPGDSAALAAAIASALSKQWDRDRLVAHVRPYSAEHSAQKLIAIYDRLMGGPEPNAP